MADPSISVISVRSRLAALLAYSANNSPSWHNLLRAEIRPLTYDNTQDINIFWPDTCPNPEAVAVEFIIDTLIPWAKERKMTPRRRPRLRA